MKFVSKNSNLRIVLRPGLPAAPLAGRDATPGIYVKFQDGIAVVNDEENIMMMRKHPGFNVDFISADEGQSDPYAYRRSEIEPGHVIQELKYGQVEGVKSSAKKAPLSPEMLKLINDLAEQRVKEILPTAVEFAMKKMAEISKEKDSVETRVENTTPRSDSFEKEAIYPKQQPQPIEGNEMFSGSEEGSEEVSDEEPSNVSSLEEIIEQKPAKRGRPATKK